MKAVLKGLEPEAQLQSSTGVIRVGMSKWPHCTCVSQEDELVFLLKDVVLCRIEVGQSILPREASTQGAGAEAPPHIPILHADHVREVTDVEGNPVRRLLQN